jgi:hypothetical protein
MFWACLLSSWESAKSQAGQSINEWLQYNGHTPVCFPSCIVEYSVKYTCFVMSSHTCFVMSSHQARRERVSETELAVLDYTHAVQLSWAISRQEEGRDCLFWLAVWHWWADAIPNSYMSWKSIWSLYYFTNVVEIYALACRCAFMTLFHIFGGCPLSSMIIHVLSHNPTSALTN